MFFSDKENSASRNFIVTAVFWLVIGMTLGLTGAIEFTAPDLSTGVPWLTFSRIRPAHVNTVAFGWLSMANIGIVLYIVPTLTRSKLFNEKLANFVCLVWNLAIFGGILCLVNGYSEGREYAEFPVPIDVMVLTGLLTLSYVVYMTAITRTVKKLYVSLWYILGTFFWMPLVYFIGNRTFVRLEGLNDGIVNWFYGHNILGMWFTTLGVGIAYYMIPKLSGRPLWSHSLSMLGFWTIAFFYAPTGTHHILQSPVPEWLKALAVVFSVALVIPVITVLTNFFMTMKGNWWQLANNLPLRFVLTGAFFYFITCIQGPFQATRSINWYLHFTQWVVGHAHVALLGTFTFFDFGAIYYILPRILNRQFYSVGLARAHYWLTLIGFLIFFSSMTIGGLVQSAGWHAGIPVNQWGIEMVPYWILRAMGGSLMWFGNVLFLLNVIQTMRAVKPLDSPDVEPAMAPAKS
ncbi:MAG: cbb3-type cytochrome c oxidase subunit I [Candidatus Melainabacteria bacterium]|nr:cbb3-type cytochrome c oxidase subunit I [Candidatus Melainabacteria bacterium]